MHPNSRSLPSDQLTDFSLFCATSMTGEMMISTIYGEQDASRSGEYIHNAEEAIAVLLVAGNFGKFLVDILPPCSRLQSFFES